MKKILLILFFVFLVPCSAFCQSFDIDPSSSQQALFWQMDQTFAENTSNPQFLKQYSLLAMKLGLWGRADMALSQMEELAPEDMHIAADRLLTLIKLGEYDFAIEKGEKLAPWLVYAPLYNNLALAYLKNGDYPKAVYMIEKAYAMNPSDVRYKLNRALVYLKSGDTAKSKELVGYILISNRDYSPALNSKGVIEYMEADAKSAEKDFSKALSVLNPSCAAFHNDALLKYENKDYEKVLQQFEKHEDSSFCGNDEKKLLAATLIGAGRNREAYFKVYELIERAPSSPELLNLAGISLFNLSRYEEAGIYFIRSLWLDPASIMAKNNLALCFKKRGIFDRSESILLDALEDEPDHPDLLFNLATVYDVQGKNEQAVEFYQRFLLFSDEAEEKKRVSDILERLRKTLPLPPPSIASDEIKDETESPAVDFFELSEGLDVKPNDLPLGNFHDRSKLINVIYGGGGIEIKAKEVKCVK